MKKYELTNETKVVDGRTLHRIRALVAFGDVQVGDLGGWIEKEENLSQEGSAWVMGSARVMDSARVMGSAKIAGSARVGKTTHYFLIGPIGSRNDTTTFFRTLNRQIFVKCGCFTGSIDEFVEAVKKTHGGTKHEKTYMLAVELAKAQIEDVKGAGESE